MGKNVTVNGITRIICSIKLGVVGTHVASLSLHCDVRCDDYLNSGNLVVERTSILHYHGCLVRGRSMLFVRIGHRLLVT
jgi:hypothetical protein